MHPFVLQILRAIAALALLLLLVDANGATAAALTTQYYNLDLPPDWTVISAPKTTNDGVQALIGQKNHKCSANIIVWFNTIPGMVEKRAGTAAKRLEGTMPVSRNGQLEFTFKKMNDSGYCIIREDKQAKLALMVIVSGTDTGQANFIYSMRSNYPALVPVRPAGLR